MSINPLAPDHHDSDAAFYQPPDGVTDARSLGFGDYTSSTAHFLVRMTPGTVNLMKGNPVDFTVHVKALNDFDSRYPVILELQVSGRGSACFVQPNGQPAPGQPDIQPDGKRMKIMFKGAEEAARVTVHTEYPADWWSGSSKVSVTAHVNALQGKPESSAVAISVEGNVIVADRTPETWRRLN